MPVSLLFVSPGYFLYCNSNLLSWNSSMMKIASGLLVYRSDLVYWDAET